MIETKEWFEEATKTQKVFTTKDGDFLVYKGFKITKTKEDAYLMQDVRYSTFYSAPSDIDLSIIKEEGFIKGVDIISYTRDLERVAFYKKWTEKLYDRKKVFKKQLSENRRLNEKRIRRADVRIDKYIDFIFYYEARIEQFESKYKIN
jgi:hypothetical protein